MAAITRLAVSNPAADTDTVAFTATSTYLVSVIATNTSPAESSRVYVWVAPLAANTEADRGYVAHHLTLEPSNSYETFKFAVINTDVIYVKAINGHTSFVVNGIDQA
jgi:hypothetical protein